MVCAPLRHFRVRQCEEAGFCGFGSSEGCGHGRAWFPAPWCWGSAGGRVGAWALLQAGGSPVWCCRAGCGCGLCCVGGRGVGAGEWGLLCGVGGGAGWVVYVSGYRRGVPGGRFGFWPSVVFLVGAATRASCCVDQWGGVHVCGFSPGRWWMADRRNRRVSHDRADDCPHNGAVGH